ncbi:MAG: hypothetical protein KJ607_12405 [Bacteroidetes bacterium]|nr:hypothetical protein [Bacteroidota bacterium]
MENNFICPKCNGFLNVSNKIVFATKSKKGDVGLIFLSPKVGDYSVEKNQEYSFEHGDQLSFFCPLCSADLTATQVSKNLAEVTLVDKDDKKHNILFSMVAGERCTYKITEDTLEAFGESAHKYVNFINLSLNK